MSGSELLHRVRCWFGGGHEEPAERHSAKTKSWPAGQEDTSKALLFTPSGSGAVASRASPAARAAPQRSDPPAPTVFPLHAPAAPRVPAPQEEPAAAAANKTESELALMLQDLPERIARSVAASAPAAQPMGQMAGELQGHRETSRAIAHAVGRLPDLAGAQADLTRRGNQLIEREIRVTEGVLDELAALRGAFRTVDESARRNLQCLIEIESTHREVLAEYQDLLVREHRRLYRLTILAVLLAAAALGGVAYMLNLMLNQ